MEKFITATGKTIDLAIAAALEQLRMDRDSVSVEVLDNPKSGFLGIGAQPARVKARPSGLRRHSGRPLRLAIGDGAEEAVCARPRVGDEHLSAGCAACGTHAGGCAPLSGG